MINNTCAICGRNKANSPLLYKEEPLSEIRYLSNGMFYHSTCLDRLEQSITQNPHLDQINSISSQIANLRQQLILENSISRKIFRFFSSDHSSIGQIQLQINLLESNLNDLQQKVDDFIRPKLNLLTEIYDYYIGQPPDWGSRTAPIRQTRECSKCGRKETSYSKLEFHIHHVVPLRYGGSNKLDNLIYVCSKCHSKLHNKKFLNYKYKTDTHRARHDEYDVPKEEKVYSFENNLKKINDAIKMNKLIRFHYTKIDGTVTKRIISPEEITYVEYNENSNIFVTTKSKPHEKSNLCVRGYCFLRNDERLFAIRRMKYLKVLTDNVLQNKPHNPYSSDHTEHHTLVNPKVSNLAKIETNKNTSLLRSSQKVRSFRVSVDPKKCIGDENCVEACPVGVFKMQRKKAVPVNVEECMGCESCIAACENDAITLAAC